MWVCCCAKDCNKKIDQVTIPGFTAPLKKLQSIIDHINKHGVEKDVSTLTSEAERVFSSRVCSCGLGFRV